MKGTKAFGTLAVIIALVCAGPAMADYTSIVHDLTDGSPDTSYSGGNLTINSTSTQLFLQDPTTLAVSPTNVDVSLSTTFSSFNPAAQPGFPLGSATFTGGSYSLTFDIGIDSYEISGPVTAIVLGVTSAGSGGSIIEGSGLFDATTVDLPGSNNWPAAGLSTIDTITLSIGIDLTGLDWNPQTTNLSNGETLYTLLPNDSGLPEPASLMLLMAGVFGLVRRRR